MTAAIFSGVVSSSKTLLHASESESANMAGEYQHSLDNKGRLFIPAKLRDELGEVFFITLSMDRCLCAYSSENWKAFSDKVSAMPYVKQRRMRPLFAHAAKCELDSQGRALIPQNLREYAGLEKNVTVIGCNNHAELWDSEAWASTLYWRCISVVH